MYVWGMYMYEWTPHTVESRSNAWVNTKNDPSATSLPIYMCMLMTSNMSSYIILYTLQREIPHIKVIDNISNLIPLHIILLLRSKTPGAPQRYMYINTLSVAQDISC